MLAATDFSGGDVIVVVTRDDGSLAAVRAAHPDVVWVEAARGQLPRGWQEAIDAADADARMSAGCFRFALTRVRQSRASSSWVFEFESGCLGCRTAFRAPQQAVTSVRRWEQDGWIRRTVRHLTLILLYFAGVSPHRLVRLDRARLEHPDPPADRKSL